MADFENKNNTQWNENNAAQNGASAPNAAGTADSVKNAAQKDRKSTRLNSSHANESRMPSSA